MEVAKAVASNRTDATTGTRESWPAAIRLRSVRTLIRFLNGKEPSMTDWWIGVVVGSFALVVAASMVIGHYRRERTRQRLLRRMDHRHCWDVMRQRR
jgi:hypothetical protein